MCGIAGIFGVPGTPDTCDIVRRMTERLVHRGPDGSGFHWGRNCVLGHRRLAIIDIEGGRQPMSAPDERYTLVFNGEIYNYLELRADLEAQGVRFRTRSDTEVLLQALIRYGEAAVDRLVGMFAFAFYDEQDGALLLARDHLGIKPLYIAELPDGTLAFASEIKALLEHPDIPARRDHAALEEYLTFQLCLGDRTLFQGIRQVRPGTLIRCRAGQQPDLRRYWHIGSEIDEYHTQTYFDDRLDELLGNSVRWQLRSDVTVGAQLSGGLDSSLVSTLAAGHHGQTIHLFHGRFAEGQAYDESHHARRIAAGLDAHLHEVVPTAAEFVEAMPTLMYFMDEPAAGPGLFPQYVVARLAADTVGVVLGGQGGDEIFAGYARYLVAYLEQALKGAIHQTQEEGRHLVTLASIVPNLSVLREYVPLMKRFWSDGLFQPVDDRYFHLINRAPDLQRLIAPDLAGAWQGNDLFDRFQGEFNRPDMLSYVNKMTAFDLETHLRALLQVEDRTSMSVSLESRVPLVDHRVVELAMAMPPAMKFAGGNLKYALKRVAERHLPAETVHRPDKMGFPVPLTDWLRAGPVRDFVRDTLLSTAARDRGLFEPQEVERMIDGERPFGRTVWALLCLELWHQAFQVT